MANSNGVITAPVSVNDVVTVLGASRYDVGYLCANRDKKINRWAKHKPVPMIGYDTTELTYKGKDGDCAVVPPKFLTSRAQLIASLDDDSYEWVYKAPRGGESEPFRLTDFDGYDHFARSPFGHLLDMEFVLSTIEPIIIQAIAPNTFSDSSLKISDFVRSDLKLGDWYFGVILHNSTYTIIATSTRTMNEGNAWQVDFGYISTGFHGEYKAVPFLSSKPWVAFGTEPSPVNMVTIEDQGSIVNLKMQTETFVVGITSYFTDDRTLYYSMKITNTTAYARNFNNCVLQVASSLNGDNASTIATFGNITVNGNSSVTKTGTVTLARTDASSFYRYIGLYYTGITSIQWGMIMQRLPTI